MVIAFAILLYLAIITFYCITQWKIYEKAEKPGWAIFVPFYNLLVLLEIVGKPTWWILLMLIPGVNVIFFIIVFHNLALSFGKESGFTIGLIFFPFIFLPILAFGDDKYIGPGGKKTIDMSENPMNPY